MPDAHPPAAFVFQVTFEVRGGDACDVCFQEVEGLPVEGADGEETSEGGENRFKHRLPGLARFESLKLRRGILADAGLIGWFRRSLAGGRIEPAKLQISLQDATGTSIVTWRVAGAGR
ncbi:MAG: phage tail protein [bacterium]